MASLINSWSTADTPPNLTVTEIDALSLPDARDLLAYYQGLPRKEGALPNRNDVDPFDLPKHVLPSVYLLEPIQDYHDWAYRLIGSDIVERFQVDRTGQSLRSFLPPDRAKALVADSNRSALTRKALLFRLHSKDTKMEHFFAETMSLPVQDQKTGKVWLFGGTFFGGVIKDTDGA